MAPSPISPSIIHIVLQYISPPSHLSHPSPTPPLVPFASATASFPPTLSRSSARVPLLSILPRTSVRAIEFLESRPRPIDDNEPSIYPVQYSSDGEYFYAHVDLSSGTDSGARLIFQWDDADGWKYHNTDLMPFPPGSLVSLEDVLHPSSNHVLLQAVPSARSYVHSFGDDNLEDDSDDDDYWNAYGAHDHSSESTGHGHIPSAKEAGNTEDAYWAQYSSVHGTADSTQPSPLPQAHRKPHPVHTEMDIDIHSPNPLPVPVRISSNGLDEYAHEEPLPIPPSVITRPRSHSKWDPASPHALAHLLEAISPRTSPLPSPAPDSEAAMDADIASPTVGGSDESNSPFSPGLGLQNVDLTQLMSPAYIHELTTHDILTPRGSCAAPVSKTNGIHKSNYPVHRPKEANEDVDEEEASLREAIQGEEAMDEESVVSDMETWDRLLNEQTVLFRKTAAKNAELEARVEELERELFVWKSALKAADEDRKMLNKTVLKLERNIGSLREDNPLVFWRTPGCDAFKKGLTDHLASIDPTDIATPSRGQVWLTIYCNKSGLLDTLISNQVCTAEEFEAFVLGFNQASPLFSIVDVGNGKEAADSKIKECLRVFTRFPQTSRVFFGGAHDNGYTSTLNYLQNEGLLDKVILLRGYRDLAHEIKNLNLPFLEIEGIFMQRKLQTNPFKKNMNLNTQSLPSVQPQDFDKFRNKSSTPGPNTSPVKKPNRLDPEQPLHRQKPPPCNFYYLATCKQGQNCRYAHDYVLTNEQLNELRVNAKKWPCPSVNQGHRCILGDNCCMSHVCPKGPKCSFRKQGKCKFVGKSMHDRQSAPRGDGESNSSTSSRVSPSGATNSPASQALSDSRLGSPVANNTMFLPDVDDAGNELEQQHNNNDPPSLLSRIHFGLPPQEFFPRYS
ncbi:hypothetical protein A0H81_01170 [Grifola frondosa]|uniref:C3H1-type domain-containing protein n=1 Tax=Grifola frondosa TaxID=5627 RepID=A0A1C7MTA3_GRIFR|nr:hypothetical protein A0H81_01170 [Grifola frondosa]